MFNQRLLYTEENGYFKYDTPEVAKLTIMMNKEMSVAVAFKGRSNKMYFRYTYTNKNNAIMQTENTIKIHFDKEMKKIETKKQELNEAKALRELVQVGDIFATSWGYEQTNVSFHQVIEKKSQATVMVREIGLLVVKETGGFSDTVSPDRDDFIGEPKKCSLDNYGNVAKADRYGHKAYKCKDDNSTHHRSWGY